MAGDGSVVVHFRRAFRGLGSVGCIFACMS